MSFVQRDCDGLIVGSFANLQPGFAEEYVSDDDPELLFVSPAQAAAGERAWRGVEINSTQWLVARHSEQLERSATTLTAQQYLELLEYRQMLRDWPAAPEFPDISQRPKAPDWLATQTQ